MSPALDVAEGGFAEGAAQGPWQPPGPKVKLIPSCHGLGLDWTGGCSRGRSEDEGETLVGLWLEKEVRRGRRGAGARGEKIDYFLVVPLDPIGVAISSLLQ